MPRWFPFRSKIVTWTSIAKAWCSSAVRLQCVEVLMIMMLQQAFPRPRRLLLGTSIVLGGPPRAKSRLYKMGRGDPWTEHKFGESMKAWRWLPEIQGGRLKAYKQAVSSKVHASLACRWPSTRCPKVGVKIQHGCLGVHSQVPFSIVMHSACNPFRCSSPPNGCSMVAPWDLR